MLYSSYIDSLDGKRYSGEEYDITGWKEVGRGMTRYITL
jgi:hypothetical protein